MNMWPEDIGQDIESKSPAAILREQASLLGNKTKNIVTAEVKRVVASPPGGGSFYYAFYLVAPAYSYQYKLFEISYGFDYYPIGFRVDDDIEESLSVYIPEQPFTDKKPARIIKKPVAKTEDEFLEILGKIFSAEKTKRIVNALITESQV